MEVDKTLVHSKLVTVPSFGTFTTRLDKGLNGRKAKKTTKTTHSLTGGDLQDLSWKTNGTLDTELLVFCTVNEIF